MYQKGPVIVRETFLEALIAAFRWDGDGREKGGLLALRGSELVDCFVDTEGKRTPSAYTPSVPALTRRLEAWRGQGLEPCFIHSHRSGEGISAQDLRFAREYLSMNHLRMTLFFVLIGIELHAYTITAEACSERPLLAYAAPSGEGCAPK